MTKSEGELCHNTDREIWREREGDYYADSIFVTERGSIGINCGSTSIVMPIREWHKMAGGDKVLNAQQARTQQPDNQPAVSLIDALVAARDNPDELYSTSDEWRKAFDTAISIIHKHQPTALDKDT